MIPLLLTQGPTRARSGAVSLVAARAIALFLGSFAVLNVIGGLVQPGFDLNLWWIDLRLFPAWLRAALLLPGGLALILFGLRNHPVWWLRFPVLATAGGFMVGALANTWSFYSLWHQGAIAPWSPVPVSALVSAGMLLICCAAVKSRLALCACDRLHWRLLGTVSGAVAGALLFALGQMLMFGKTDYRRHGDVAVVMGARVYADGRLSDALSDRVRTACELYREGRVRRLIMSGGPGDGAVHETEGMKRAAVAWGVAPEDILLDQKGLNTQATVQNAPALFRDLYASRIIVVSHGYHLPRIKMAFQRAGIEVYTVPARESYMLRQMPFNMARETAAIWAYYLRPLAVH